MGFLYSFAVFLTVALFVGQTHGHAHLRSYSGLFNANMSGYQVAAAPFAQYSAPLPGHDDVVIRFFVPRTGDILASNWLGVGFQNGVPADATSGSMAGGNFFLLTANGPENSQVEERFRASNAGNGPPSGFNPVSVATTNAGNDYFSKVSTMQNTSSSYVTQGDSSYDVLDIYYFMISCPAYRRTSTLGRVNLAMPVSILFATGPYTRSANAISYSPHAQGYLNYGRTFGRVGVNNNFDRRNDNYRNQLINFCGPSAPPTQPRPTQAVTTTASAPPTQPRSTQAVTTTASAPPTQPRPTQAVTTTASAPPAQPRPTQAVRARSGASQLALSFFALTVLTAAFLAF